MVALSDTARTAIQRLMADDSGAGGLRIMVEQGGCSGLQYMLGIETAAQDDRRGLRLRGRAHLRRSDEPADHPRHDGRFRRLRRVDRLHLRQPQRRQPVQLRKVVLVMIARRPDRQRHAGRRQRHHLARRRTDRRRRLHPRREADDRARPGGSRRPRARGRHPGDGRRRAPRHPRPAGAGPDDARHRLVPRPARPTSTLPPPAAWIPSTSRCRCRTASCGSSSGATGPGCSAISWRSPLRPRQGAARPHRRRGTPRAPTSTSSATPSRRRKTAGRAASATPTRWACSIRSTRWTSSATCAGALRSSWRCTPTTTSASPPLRRWPPSAAAPRTSAPR